MRVLRWVDRWPIWLTRAAIVATGLLTVLGWAGVAYVRANPAESEIIAITNATTTATVTGSLDGAERQSIAKNERREFRSELDGRRYLRLLFDDKSRAVIDLSFMADRYLTRFEITLDEPGAEPAR